MNSIELYTKNIRSQSGNRPCRQIFIARRAIYEQLKRSKEDRIPLEVRSHFSDVQRLWVDTIMSDSEGERHIFFERRDSFSKSTIKCRLTEILSVTFSQSAIE